jgi:hypothetical protein
MVAEPFIFLSSDRQVDVRCCMAGQTPLFCVVDFIRRTANRRMGPLDALQYWMDISLRLQSEHDVMNSFVYKFPGPYERPNVCITANGLLALYHHMEAMHRLVNAAYRTEVTQRLMEVVEGKGGQYIEEYDDGEVEEQMLEGGEEEGVWTAEPPRHSRFWFTPTVKNDQGGDELPLEEALERKVDETLELKAAVARKDSELNAARQRATSREGLLNTRILELEQALSRKRCRDTAFNLTAAIKCAGLDVQEHQLKGLCKRVVARFRRDHPSAPLDRRQHVVHFPCEYRADVERLLREEFLQMEMERCEREHCVAGAVAEKSVFPAE